MDRISRLAVLAFVLLNAAPARSIQLTWPDGRHDFATATAARCTLLVVASHGLESLPSEWRLLWSAETSATDSIGFLANSPAGGPADVCSARPPLTAEEIESHILTVEHCSLFAVGRSDTARYTLDVPAGAQASFMIVTLSGGLSASPETQATLNGGSQEALPPLPIGVALERAGDSIHVVARGANLLSASMARIVPLAAAESVLVEIATLSDTVLVGSAYVPYPTPASRLLVMNGENGAGAARMAPDTLGYIPHDHFIVHFAAGAVDPPVGRTEAALDLFTFRTTGLRESLNVAGVGALRRLFPSFRHEDVHSTNLIGEPILLDDLADYYIASTTAPVDASSVTARLSAVPGVLRASPDRAFSNLLATFNDPLFPQQWGINSGQSVCGRTPGINIHAQEAWDVTHGSPQVPIAFLDTGIDPTHEEFTGRVQYLKIQSFPNSFDASSIRHGTAVAGIATAAGNNGKGITGIAFAATPWGIRVASSGGFTVADLTEGIGVAVANYMPIINMSLGSYGADLALNAACLNGFYKGDLLVAAMSNDNDGIPVYPAAFANRVYAVGAVWMNGTRWEDATMGCDQMRGSSYGSWLDIMAPGGHMIQAPTFGPSSYEDLTTCVDGACSLFAGTSAAAPAVAGVAALLKSAAPTLLGEDITQIINRNAQTLTFGPLPDFEYGWGLVRADLAMNYVRPPAMVIQGWLGAGGSFGALADSGFVNVTEHFVGTGLPNGDRDYSTERHRLVGSADIGFAFPSNPDIWTRGSGSIGWKDTTNFDYSYEVNWARVIPGSISPRGARFETFVYHVRDPNNPNNFIAWKPVAPSAAQIAFTLVGRNPPAAVSPSPGASLSLTTVPNPGREHLVIRFNLPSDAFVRGTIFDAAGRIVATVINARYPAGRHETTWMIRDRDGRKCASGIYFMRLDVSGHAVSRKFAVLE